MFKAIKDTNTGFVYDWVKKLKDGTTLSVNIPSTNWKKEQEWSTEEIEALFNTTPLRKSITTLKKPKKETSISKEIIEADNTEVDLTQES